MPSATYCANPDCERATQEGRKWCARCYKNVQRHGRCRPPAEQLPPEERFFEAARRWVETNAEDDQAYEANRRAAYAAARSAVGREAGQAVRAGMARAQRRGVQLGRPPKLQTDDRVRLIVARVGISVAAQLLAVHRNTLARALQRSIPVQPPPRGRAPKGSNMQHAA